VHLYDSYTRPSDANAVPDWLATQIASYAANGLQVELVLTYRPANPAGDVAGFVNYVRARVRQLGPIPSVTDLQVTNEFNVTNAPNAADGWYPGANDALVQGIIAAHAEVVRGGFSQLKVGFNWAYQTGKAEQDRFRTLGRKGGAALKAAVDWVGIDAYPGTWGPSLASGSLSSGAGAATVDAMRTLRQGLMPLAGLSAATIHFSESGYPTGSGRTPAMQETVMRAAIAAVVANRTTYGVSDYRWFDLRDADSANPSFESQYGITRDDYSPKPAFFAYHDLIAANAG
jgi:hypothetical protein